MIRTAGILKMLRKISLIALSLSRRQHQNIPYETKGEILQSHSTLPTTNHPNRHVTAFLLLILEITHQ